MIRNNKPLLFLILGFIGGAIGSFLSEFLPEMSEQSDATVLVQTSIWTSLTGGMISLALFVASEIYHRRRGFLTGQALKYVFAGVVGGLIAGAVAQAVYSGDFVSPTVKNFVLRPICWGIMGAILGWRLASTIPNLTRKRAAIAGGIGGVVGGVVFLFVGYYMPEAIGRLVGVGALGAALGLAIVVVDSMFREASLEIVWAPREVTTVALGAIPVTIGGGDDHVFVAGLAQASARIVIEHGKIQYVDTATQRRTELRDGSKLKIGRIEVIVHATR
jgi:uncharacterized membrane protein YeaQ/YmgE (transglycosylase-associated protein family)